MEAQAANAALEAQAAADAARTAADPLTKGAKLREKHRKGGALLDTGHYGPGGGAPRRAYGGRSGEDVYASDHVRDYRGRLDDRDRRRGDRRDPGRSLGIEGLDDRRDRDRSRRDRSRERSRRDRDRERRKRSRSRERSRRRH